MPSVFKQLHLLDDDFYIFILLSRENDGDAMNRTNPEFQTRLDVALVSNFSA